MVYETLVVAKQLSEAGIRAEVINMHTIKPLDDEAVIKSARKTGKVVTIEEHNVIGGLGDEVASALSEQLPTPLLKIGITDRYGESGSHRELWKKYGLDRENIRTNIKGWLIRKGFMNEDGKWV